MKLTKKQIDNLPLSDDLGVIFHWDESLPGFGLKISATKKVFVAQGKVLGRTCRVTIGTYGKITLDQARERAKEYLADMLRGINPNAEKRRAKALDVSLEKAVADFLLARKNKLKKTTVGDIERHMKTSFEDWKKKPVAKITRRMVSSKFLKLTSKSKAQGNQAFRYLRSILNYARATYRDSEGSPLLPENPVQVLSDSRLWNTVQPRNKKIPLSKVGIAWNALTEYRFGEIQNEIGRTLGDTLAFIMLTGCRLNEACNLKWKDVDLEKQRWKIDDPKNHQTVTFPLPDVLVEMLESRSRKNDFVFNNDSKRGHVARLEPSLKPVREAVGETIACHDLRRTFVAIAGKVGVPYDRVKLLLNHKTQDVTTKHYVESSDLQYLKDDLERITSWVIEQGKIAAADNVVLMKKLA